MSDQLMLFAGDTHANPLVSPGTEKARKMTVTSGRNLVGSWTRLGPLGSLEKMLLATSIWASTTCFLTWKEKVTPQGRLLFQLAPSTPRTDETECGLWLTPTAVMTVEAPEKMKARARKNGYRNGTSIGSLASQVKYAPKIWQTPVADDAVNRVAGKVNSRGEPKLSAQAKMWPTPHANCGTGAGQSDGKQGAPNIQTAVGGQLNPRWVEWLMGYPDGWTDLEDSETPSCPRSPKSSDAQ